MACVAFRGQFSCLLPPPSLDAMASRSRPCRKKKKKKNTTEPWPRRLDTASTLSLDATWMLASTLASTLASMVST
eukprot:2573873-Prymnesium_polylepis.1